LAAINNALKDSNKSQYFVISDIKELIFQYIKENALEENATRGHINLDPFISRLVGDLKPDQR
jgi:hypothetical protein